MDQALTKKELASLSGYSYRRLHEIDMALPEREKLFVKSEQDEKKYSLALFIQRWAAYNAQAAEAESEELSAIKAKHEAVKMEKTRIEVSRMKNELVPISELAPIWSNIAATVADRFNALPSKVAASLVMIGDAEIIEEKIEREIRDAMSLMSEMPLPETGTEKAQEEETEE
ncbi:MAG: hypothetical protein IJ188_06460 [Clostridia bacterium]|nr:hypothetical protein [Clostridia bacterium]